METNATTKRIPAARRGGFTLLELIAVIGIIAVMVTVVVGGFNGMMTASARSSAAQTFERAINLARQEAAVEGSDTYVYVVDIDRYAIVRKAGTITDVLPSGELPWIGRKRPDLSVKVTAKRWILDAYADLGARQPPLDDIDLTDEQESRDLLEKRLKDYDGEYVFNIENGAIAKVQVPVDFNAGLDAWYFGIDNLPSPAKASIDKFNKDDRYGWITHPVFSLPEGWVFAGTWNDDGSFKFENKNVHFDEGGSVEKEESFTIENPAKGQSFSFTVNNAGARRQD